ncbi:ABC-type antimicrobial peptide transport system, permease component [Pedobacter terrae]|uniref:ABC-type antimicrobial peptide transport system, permease component n=1 Tax=Pedobacter terrae TaxID=405671 RepID=A0A1G7UZV5_9SPHI|nr:ABC transporter permease [Pedobacter terrae]SDG52818.1 ABC-type antimicrobial peptide transport system, permease component [Pedobacter terrae]
MFKLNLKIALRNLWKNKTSSFINVIGLAIGLAACLMLLLYVTYEWNFDKQGKESANVFTTMTNIFGDNGKTAVTFEGSTTAFGPAIKQGLPKLKYVARMDYGGKNLIANGQNAFKCKSKFAEPDILKMYDYQFIQGNPNTALNSPNSVIVTESTAKLLFGTTDVLNKIVRFKDQFDLNITGVIKDQPDNSSNKFDYLMPWSLYETVDESAKDLNWSNYSFITLIMLKNGANLDLVNQKIAQIEKKNNTDNQQSQVLFPLAKLHLYGQFDDGKSVGGAIEQIYLFVGLAFGILLIACINFMNMATAKSEKRAKEVGIKKTIGANRSSLIIQFLTESMMLTFIAVVFSIALLELFLPTFNNLLSIKLDISYFNSSSWFGILGIVIVTGLIAGSYPAFYLSSFNPIQTLKRKIKSKGFFSVSLRQVLVVGQFCFAIILIISTLVIYKQIQYIKNRPVGFDVNALVEMPQDGELKTKYDLLRSELLKSGAVTSMFQSSVSLSHHGRNFSGIAWEGMLKATNNQLFNRVITTYDFIKTNGIKLTDGRDFSENFASDTSAVMVSASAVKIFGYKNPVGKTITIFGDKFNIIGVFDDYVWDSPYKSNNPMVVFFDQKQTGNITMRLNESNSLQSNIETISRITKALNPAYPLEINFLNNVYAEKYNAEKTLGILSNLFGGLAIFVSCLGLFGLVTYSAEQRTKEFGVRKVLGASLFNLMQLLSLSFMKMIVVSMIIAIPLSYFLMNKWLIKFEFHTEISWWIMPLAGFGTLMMALITVSFQAYKTAKANPVDALKYE